MSNTNWQQMWELGRTGWDLGASHPLTKVLINHYEQVFPGQLRSAKVCIPGCGRAHDATEFLHAGADVVACDISPLAIASARKCHEDAESLTLKVGDFLDPSFLGAESFDLVFDRAMLCALDGEERRNYMAQVWRILRPGACFLSIPFTQVLVPQGPPFALDLRSWLLDQGERFGLVTLAEGYPGSVPAAVAEEALVILQKLGAAK